MGPPHGIDGVAPLAPPAGGARQVAYVDYRRHVIFWASALLLLLLSVWLLREILLPFVMGMVLAYLFSPLASLLQRRGISRTIGALLIITLVVLGFMLLLLLIAPVLGSQLAAFVESLPRNFARLQALVSEQSLPWLRSMLGESIGTGDAAIGDLLTQGAGWMAGFMKSLWSGGAALISIFSLVVVTPIVAFYLLVDWERMIAKVDSWVPDRQRETVRCLAREIDAGISGFVRGQSTVCLLLGAFYAVSLSMAGLNFGLLIGLVAGIITFIPYVGSLTGLVLAVGVAVAQFWPDWGSILLIAGIFLFGQFIEGNFLQPKLVGESVGLHPVWIIFALFASGYLFGFVGMLLAVPIAVAVGALARFGMRRYLDSSLHEGPPTVVVAQEPPAVRLPGQRID